MEAKPEGPCLSQLTLGRLASGQRAADAQEARHLARCAFCRAQLAEETALAQAAAQEPLPAAIAAAMNAGKQASDTGREKSFFARHAGHFQHGMMAVLAVVAVGFVARQLAEVPSRAFVGERAKGAVQILGAVKDANNQVHALDDLTHLGALQVGDTLQVQVQSFDAAQITLTDADDQTVYYTGPVPEGGWLPVGVEVTPDGPLHLDVRVCPLDHGSPCQTWELR